MLVDLPPRIFLHQRLDYAVYVTTNLYVKNIEFPSLKVNQAYSCQNILYVVTI